MLRRASSLTVNDLTGTGLGKDHRVAVFQREAVKNNQAGVVHVDAVQNAVVLAQVGAGEREAGAERAGAHVAADLQLVDQLRHGAVQPLLLLRGGRLAVDQLLAEHRLDLVADEFQLFHAAGVKREVQAKAEEALFADLQLVAHFFGVEDGRLLARVAHPALFGVDLDAGFQLRHFLAQVFEHHLAFHRVDVHAHIHDFVEVDHAAQPAGVELARIAIDIIGAGKAGAELEVACC